ncbi:glycosyltransferase family 4 protein [Synechococcus elongatus]|uniref:Glycosyltransferase family 4 protein n=1 Tax=Synechococcus elongatus PCC 11802 TaxID=2283154 RepID=A0AAT9JYQ8_SYNEL|nr:glycosyltransferase family 4 protein [Synechococcus elongatus]QFZ91313.1 glycosyltransferase [Synechococcus elongatus PCC 11802]
MNPRIVTAASGRRDNYQVPIALAEANLLERHITDQYLPDALLPFIPALGSLGHKLVRRHSGQLPSAQVYCSRRLALKQATAALVPILRSRFQSDQDPISWSALRLAKQHQSALLLYAGYAFKAFTAEPLTARWRGLIQYHPHIRDSAVILRNDTARFPFLQDALVQLHQDEQDQTNLPELKIADLIICNSSFTASTCVSLGISADKVQVIPYGIDPPPPAPPLQRQDKRCQFLFVGSGIQRKGLHHLLLAWKQAALRHSKLTIVSRSIDPQIAANVDPGNNVEILQGVDHQLLDTLYRCSDVFVLPSLIEGFGYVYLEAMVRGCFCIGTTNTGLPDIATTSSAQVLPAGDLEQLTQALQQAEDRHASGQFNRDEIASVATARPWQRFRQELVATVRHHLLG